MVMGDGRLQERLDFKLVVKKGFLHLLLAPEILHENRISKGFFSFTISSYLYDLRISPKYNCFVIGMTQCILVPHKEYSRFFFIRIPARVSYIIYQLHKALLGHMEGLILAYTRT